LEEVGGEGGVGERRPVDGHTLAFVLHATVLEPDLKEFTKKIINH
jgi:hypothetical protein